MTRRRPPIRCAPGTAERVVQGAVGLLLVSFALDSLADPMLTVVAALGAVLLLVGAIRGWCPGGLLAQRAAARAPEEQPAER